MRSRSICCRRKWPSGSRWCRAGRAPTRCSAATAGIRRSCPPTTPPSNISDAYFDWKHADLKRLLAPDVISRGFQPRLRRCVLRATPRAVVGRQGAADRHRDHAGRRSRQTRRQHDHGVRAWRRACRSSIMRWWSSPRAFRPTSRSATAANTSSRKPRARFVPAEVIDRPKGYFPVPSLRYLRGPFLDLCAATS